jgi:hypothetical protein
MGYLMNGMNAGILNLRKSESQLAITIQILMTVCTIGFMVAIAKFHILSTRRYTRWMLGLLSVSLGHQICGFLFFHTNSPPIVNFVFTVLGYTTLLLVIIVETLVLEYFSVLQSWWNIQKIVLLRGFWFLLYVGCIGGYAFNVMYLGKRPPLWASFWTYYGTSLFSFSCSLYDTLQYLFILYLLYRHFRETKKETFGLRIPHLVSFLSLCVFLNMLDWLVIIWYGFLDFSMEENAILLSLIHFRVCMMSVTFNLLRYISTVRDEQLLSQPKTEPVKLLKDIVPAQKWEDTPTRIQELTQITQENRDKVRKISASSGTIQESNCRSRKNSEISGSSMAISSKRRQSSSE